uniref:Uncharacterized protein n=1 Tax=Tanacetum cinerariifolium TaxID=118510 RepID=A0A699L1I5_TANCI|nr:hypothetical protein [Tanacetum cinerariifolium]
MQVSHDFDNITGSHIKHIPPASSLAAIRDALSSSPPIITLTSIQQREIALATWKKIAREKENRQKRKEENKENHRKRKEENKDNRRKRKENHVAPAPPPKVSRLKSIIVSGCRTY